MSACIPQPQRAVVQPTRLTPPELQVCAEGVLARGSVRTERAPAGETLWRLRLHVLTSAPKGWIEKGSLIYNGAEMYYLPNGATRGLRDAHIERALAPLWERCAERAAGLSPG